MEGKVEGGESGRIISEYELLVLKNNSPRKQSCGSEGNLHSQENRQIGRHWKQQ